MKIAGSVGIVTGASSGIGEATARLLHARGMRVVLAARRGDRLAALAAELPGTLAITTDVTDARQVDDLVRATIEAAGRIDVLINYAGQGLHVPLAAAELDDVRAVLELNVLAPLALMKAVLPTMRAGGGGGAIVNISSGTTRRVIPGVGPYAATKAALNTLSDVARAELAGEGIVVSLVLPAIVDTAFHEVMRAGKIDVRARPKCSAEQVAAAVVEAIETGQPEIVVMPEAPTAAAGGASAASVSRAAEIS
ncbi:MAG: SDR family NAD(P)-dependent oxidoreductase [Acidothermaceae bacterium]